MRVHTTRYAPPKNAGDYIPSRLRCPLGFSELAPPWRFIGDEPFAIFFDLETFCQRTRLYSGASPTRHDAPSLCLEFSVSAVCGLDRRFNPLRGHRSESWV